MPTSPPTECRLTLRLCVAVAYGFLAIWSATPVSATPPPLPSAEPAAARMDAGTLDRIDAVVRDGLDHGEMAGCVVLIGRQGKIVYRRAWGNRQVEPQPIPMTIDTVFDLASLTKPIATATSVMALVERGALDLSAPASHYVPEFGNHGKEAITLLHLLTHQGGLTPDNSLDDYQDGVEESFRRIHALPTIATPGERFIYSDVGFLMLGEIVERVSGQRLHDVARTTVFEPLGMTETGYLPAESLRQRAAATEQREGRWMVGEVHDPRAYAVGGVAGHAGLFSTANDLARYAQMILGGGEYGGVRILKPETVALMGQAVPVTHRDGGRGERGLGWDKRTGYSTNRGATMSSAAIGHGGFTGTAIWIDPARQLFVIFLSTRLHPDGKGTVNPLAGRIATIAAAAIDDPDAQAAGVLNGIDVLERDGFALLRGQRIGLITNHTGSNRRRVSTIKLLREAPDVQLTALFSPEHGLEGKLDVARIDDSQDATSGLKIFSLYGESRRPSAESLQEIDTLVFDIQDIGTRFYTYVSTMGHAMQAAAEQRRRFVVLDRVNPIGGVAVAGPVLDAGSESFVGYHTLPVRHGMTVGELARMFRAELDLDLELWVVPVEGWRRDVLFDATGLPWVNPSPNMRNLHQALLYPGVGLLETTNVSVGRGTDTPFELFGAPWIDDLMLARELNNLQLPGLSFVPVRFTPASSKFANEACGGVQILITDRRHVEPLVAGLQIAATLRRLYPDDWKVDGYRRLLSHQTTWEKLVAGHTAAEIMADWEAGLGQFRARRERFLLYGPY